MQENIYKDDELEIDLLELFFVILRHWKLLIVAAVLTGGVAWGISNFLMTPQYEAQSALYVLSKSTSITSLADIQMGTNLTNDYMVVVKGRPVLEQVILNLGISENYAQLKSKITLTNPSNTRILQITVQDASPEKAKLIADELANVSSNYIAEKMDQDPPTIIQYAYSDGAPVGPNVLKNTCIGIAIGLFLVVAYLVVDYLLHDTIMSPDDIEKKLGLTVLGTVLLEDGDEDKKHTKIGSKKNSSKSTDKKGIAK